MKCRGCGREVVWVKTTKGKKMPLDPDSIEVTTMPVPIQGGPVLGVTEDGRVINGWPKVGGETVVRISHFATCPNADEFRK